MPTPSTSNTPDTQVSWLSDGVTFIPSGCFTDLLFTWPDCAAVTDFPPYGLLLQTYDAVDEESVLTPA